LLDVRNYQGFYNGINWPPPFDGSFVTNDSISRVYADSVNATSATAMDTFGLVTLFSMFPIPQLAATQTTNSVLLTWPTQPTVFVLQGSASLKPPNWQTITNGITGNALNQTLTLPRASLGSKQFFRLVWPSGPSGGN
jgi:hypothetical protein